jgi:TonB family protein
VRQLAILWIAAAALSGATETYRTGPGVKPPKVVHRVEAAYSTEARAARIQGIVLLEFVVSREGRATNVTVASPLGYGLDQRARAAVEAWEFRPATRGGEPVEVAGSAEILFRFRRGFFDWGAEQKRMRFNVAIRSLQQRDPQRRAAAIETIQDLARKKYPPAVYRLAKMLEAGNGVTRDLSRSRDLLQQAAKKNYPPAVFETGRMYLEGRGLPLDEEKGRQMIRAAAVRGSVQAQYFLGAAYESGSGYPQSDTSARQFFRICATQGQIQCQYRLGKLLLSRPDRSERDYIQGVAWLELAAANGAGQAEALLQATRGNLSEPQIAQVEDLKLSLVRR